ncbi:MAG: hypothetical protein HY204_03890 [Nitrospirae bacterium]|nr:hypothetical protein [Nitrospirota bacterium]
MTPFVGLNLPGRSIIEPLIYVDGGPKRHGENITADLPIPVMLETAATLSNGAIPADLILTDPHNPDHLVTSKNQLHRPTLRTNFLSAAQRRRDRTGQISPE